jgi:murein endopeptidase
VASVAVWCLAACGVTHTPLETAAGDATSATGSAALALRGLDDGDLLSTVAETTIDDAVTTASKAAKEVSAYRAKNVREKRLQEQAVEAIADAVRDLHRARDGVSSPGLRERLAKRLTKDRDRLDKIATKAGSVR